ncbi:MAG: hypothetical protein PHS79_05535 [Patescibacteria group bacterium]|nr:hypothetical protein [Patescibacteria group bacterium]
MKQKQTTALVHEAAGGVYEESLMASDKPDRIALSQAASGSTFVRSRDKLIEIDKYPGCVFKVKAGSVDVELESANQFKTVDRLEEGDYFRFHPASTQNMGYRIRYRVASERAALEAKTVPDILASMLMLKEVVLSLSKQSLVLQGVIANGSLPKDATTGRGDLALLESIQEELELQIQENGKFKQLVDAMRRRTIRMDEEHADWKALRDNALVRYKALAEKATQASEAAQRVIEEARQRQRDLELHANRIQRGLDMISRDNPKMFIRDAALHLLLGEEPPRPDDDDIEALSRRFLDSVEPPAAQADDSIDWDDVSTGELEVIADDGSPTSVSLAEPRETMSIGLEPEEPSAPVVIPPPARAPRPAPARRITPPPLPAQPPAFDARRTDLGIPGFKSEPDTDVRDLLDSIRRKPFTRDEISPKRTSDEAPPSITFDQGELDDVFGSGTLDYRLRPTKK